MEKATTSTGSSGKFPPGLKAWKFYTEATIITAVHGLTLIYIPTQGLRYRS